MTETYGLETIVLSNIMTDFFDRAKARGFEGCTKLERGFTAIHSPEM